ncbi:MAG: alpha/beta hydrolase [Moraxellaceae bacterium]|nr:alpha/beta hydrolase [Moraxellaceae bacterium]MDP1775080.1 alpha/beta hydrolase [Moraxellaceae bacterium]MDZ4297326.1 alpha/beta hydrolase [Moraxellaceae bacterium]MDZ4386430.1 alpha/beta hydrolase [Moraxellaceae bacterium]
MTMAQVHVSTHRPQVTFHDNPHNRHVVSALRRLHEDFTPTPWLFNAHAQLIFHGLRKNLSRQKQRAITLYDHHDALTMSDGGRTELLWCGHDLSPTLPTIVVLHTITGSPASMAELVRDLHVATGWRIVLCLRRGHADLPLVTPRLNILGCTDDLRDQLRVIRTRFPESPLYGVGSSAGSGLLARYLGEEGGAALFRAAFAYCPGYDTDVGFERTQPFYSRMMAKKLVRQFITPNLARIEHLPTTASLQAADDLADFHRNLYELAGYDSYEAYDRASNPMHVFHAIRTPVMLLNSEDDPVCRIGNLAPWLDGMRQMPNIILVTTAKGSHCAHYEGWSARSWSAQLMGEYFLAMQDLM